MSTRNEELIASYERAVADVEQEIDEVSAASIERLQLSRERGGLLNILEGLRDELSWIGGSDSECDPDIMKAAG